MLKTIQEDIQAVKRNDPAAHGWLEIVLCHPPLHAILVHRMAHWIYTRLGLRLLARLIAVANRFWTGVEIHPGARLGRGFFIDHGAGVVIGESAVVGDYCVMFHNVSLGGTGKYNGQIQSNMDEGIRRQVPSTPTFFIGNRKVTTALPYDAFKRHVDEVLAQQRTAAK